MAIKTKKIKKMDPAIGIAVSSSVQVDQFIIPYSLSSAGGRG